MNDRKWLPLNALRAFEAVARHSSFSAGAQSLSVTPSAISRHVGSLETLLGKRLVERRPSGVVLTEAGQKLRPVVEGAFDRIVRALGEIKSAGSSAQRVLRIHMPPTFLQRIGMQVLKAFRTEFPEIQIDVSSTSVNGLPGRPVDVAVVYDRPRVSSAIMDLLWMERVTLVCSPEFARANEGRPLSTILGRAELLHVRVEGQEPHYLWAQCARQARLDLDVSRGVTFDTLALALDYAVRGDGVVLCDIDLFIDDMIEGRLGVPSDIEMKDGFGYFLALDAADLDDPYISLFRNWMIAHFARIEHPAWQDLRARLKPAAPAPVAREALAASP